MGNTILQFTELLKEYVSKWNIQNPTESVVFFYFTYNEKDYLIHFSDTFFYVVSKSEDGAYKHEIKAEYDNDLNYLGVIDTSLIKKDFDFISVNEFLKHLN